MVAIDVNWASIPLRLLLGIIFLVHGYPKLKDFKGTAKFLASIGFKPGAFWGAVLGFFEFFGALALLSGFASRIFSAALIVSMTVAAKIKKFKWKKTFSGEGGWEFDALIIAALMTLLLLGSGSLSIDSYLGWMLG